MIAFKHSRAGSMALSGTSEGHWPTRFTSSILKPKVLRVYAITTWQQTGCSIMFHEEHHTPINSKAKCQNPLIMMHPHAIKCTINLNSIQWEPTRLCRAASIRTKKWLLAWTLKHQRLILSTVPLQKVTLICKDIMPFFVSTLMAHADKWRQNERCKSESSLLFVRAHLINMRRSFLLDQQHPQQNLCDHFCKTLLGISSILCWTLTSRK